MSDQMSGFENAFSWLMLEDHAWVLLERKTCFTTLQLAPSTIQSPPIIFLLQHPNQPQNAFPKQSLFSRHPTNLSLQPLSTSAIPQIKVISPSLAFPPIPPRALADRLIFPPHRSFQLTSPCLSPPRRNFSYGRAGGLILPPPQRPPPLLRLHALSISSILSLH